MPCFFLQIIVVTLHQKEPLPLKLTIHNMTKVATNILSLNSKDALDFFMKSEQYHGFELPEYFNFDKVLKAVAKTVGNKIKSYRGIISENTYAHYISRCRYIMSF